MISPTHPTPPQESRAVVAEGGDAYNSTHAAALASRGMDEYVNRVTSLKYGDRARPVGWSAAVRVVDVEALDADHVQILWEMGDPAAQTPTTVFRRDEYVLTNYPAHRDAPLRQVVMPPVYSCEVSATAGNC